MVMNCRLPQIQMRWLLAGLLAAFLQASWSIAQPPDAVGDADAGSQPNDLYRSTLRPVPPSLRRSAPQSGSATRDAWINDNCVLGQPKPESGFDLGPMRIVAREGYVLAHSSMSKIPYWVCEHVTKAETEGSADRDNSSFKPDPELDGFPRAELSDYRGSGFDRGHMAPAADFKSSQSLMNQSFFLSNMVPQYGPTFNQGIWAQLESTARGWVRKRGEAWIVSGPMFYDPLEEEDETADGLVPYETIGEGEVAVPTHTFKIILAKKESGQWEAIAFMFDNKRHARPYRLDTHRTTIDWLEARTGFDFFPEMFGDAAFELVEKKKSDMWEGE
jgi:endonuclease G